MRKAAASPAGHRKPAGGVQELTTSLFRYGGCTPPGCPRLHELAPLVERAAPPVGVFYGIGKCGFSDFRAEGRLRRRPPTVDDSGGAKTCRGLNRKSASSNCDGSRR